MIQRIRQYTKKDPSRDARKIYLVCEGDNTEPDYFAYFKGLSSNISIIPIPSENGKTDPVRLKEWVEAHMISEMSDYYLNYGDKDVIWFVIDTDEWQEQGKIKELKDFCSDKNAMYRKANTGCRAYEMWNVAQSNPMFEIWYYFHIFKEIPNVRETAEYASFKEFVNNKINGGFDISVHPAYMEDAIKNARNVFSVDDEGYPALFTTEVYRIGKMILPFVKKELDRLKAKVDI